MKSRLVIVQGEDKLITLRIANDKGDPFDLTGADILKAIFKKADGTLLTKELLAGVVIVNAPGGKFTVSLNETETATLLVKEEQDFEVEIEIAAKTSIVQFKSVLSVRKRIA